MPDNKTDKNNELANVTAVQWMNVVFTAIALGFVSTGAAWGTANSIDQQDEFFPWGLSWVTYIGAIDISAVVLILGGIGWKPLTKVMRGTTLALAIIGVILLTTSVYAGILAIVVSFIVSNLVSATGRVGFQEGRHSGVDPTTARNITGPEVPPAPEAR